MMYVGECLDYGGLKTNLETLRLQKDALSSVKLI